MRCQRCGHQIYGLCLNCEGYLFDEEIEVRTSGVRITKLLEEKQKLSDQSKERGVTIFNLRIVVTISVSIGLALSAWVVELKRTNPPIPNPPPIPQPERRVLGPNNYLVAKDFSVEGQLRDVNIRVSAECNDCSDKSLAMLLLNEINYQRFKFRMNYEPRHEGFGLEEFGFDGILERDHYYVVFYNTSLSRSVSLIVDVDVRYN
jgi:hypothetical protein